MVFQASKITSLQEGWEAHICKNLKWETTLNTFVKNPKRIGKWSDLFLERVLKLEKRPLVNPKLVANYPIKSPSIIRDASTKPISKELIELESLSQGLLLGSSLHMRVIDHMPVKMNYGCHCLSLQMSDLKASFMVRGVIEIEVPIRGWIPLSTNVIFLCLSFYDPM